MQLKALVVKVNYIFKFDLKVNKKLIKKINYK